MKKNAYLLSIVLAVCTLGTGIAAYIFYLSETVDEKNVIALIFFGLCIVSLATLVNILIRFKQMRKENFLENRLNMWNTISYRVKKAGETAFNELPIGILVLNNDFLLFLLYLD